VERLPQQYFTALLAEVSRHPALERKPLVDLGRGNRRSTRIRVRVSACRVGGACEEPAVSLAHLLATRHDDRNVAVLDQDVVGVAGDERVHVVFVVGLHLCVDRVSHLSEMLPAADCLRLGFLRVELAVSLNLEGVHERFVLRRSL
jgi:hypothetical protein